MLKWKVAISVFPASQGSAKPLDRWDGKTNHRLISNFFSNTSSKNYRNRIMHVKIISYSKSKLGRFFETQCIVLSYMRPNHEEEEEEFMSYRCRLRSFVSEALARRLAIRWWSNCITMTAPRSRCGHYIFVLWFLLLSSFFLLFPRLISTIADWMVTILSHMMWP